MEPGDIQKKILKECLHCENMTMKRKFSRIVVGLICCVALMFCGCDGGITPPLTVNFRKSLLDSTRVMQLTNRSGKETLVVLVLVIDGRNKSKQDRHLLKIRPGDTEEVGWVQADFNFERGDEFKVSCDGYMRSFSGTVP